MVVLRIPSSLGLTGALEFAHKLNDITPSEDLELDFSQVTWVQPFGMLYTAQSIKRFIDENSHINVAIAGIDLTVPAISYAANVGFFRAWGVEHPYLTALAQGGSTYLPVTQLPLTSVHSSQHLGREVEAIANDLAARLVYPETGNMLEAISYAMREVIRNVAEHSNSTHVWYCAQYLPKKGTIEIAILDSGVGLRSTLLQNPYIRDQLTTDREALMYALTPGISGKMYKGIKIEHNNDWQNSGFGLYMNYRLCNEGGSFFICSGEAGLYREKGKADNIHKITAYQGTALRLSINVTTLNNLNARLKAFADEGANIAKDVGEGVVPTPSRISTMLRDNFKERTFSSGDEVRHSQYGNGLIQEIYEKYKKQVARVNFEGGRSATVEMNTLRHR